MEVKLGISHVTLADSFINAEVLLHHGKDSDGSDCPLITVRVLCHLTDDDRNLV